MLRVLFFGTPEFAVPSLEALLSSSSRVVGVVTQPDKPRGRGQHVSASPVKQKAEAASVPVWQPTKLRDEDFLDRVRALGPDLGVVAAYGKILPEALLQIPRLGMINVHASVLPKYRGAAPIQRAIIEGDKSTGVTIMRVVKELDAGPMMLADWLTIEANETNEELEPRLATLGAGLLLTAIDQMVQGTLTEIPQDDSKATYASRIQKVDGRLEWDQAAQAIHDRVRGLHPWPHAYTFHDRARYVIHETRPYATINAAVETLPEELAASARQQAEGAWPGTVLVAAKGHLIVSAGMGSAIEIRRLQEEGRKVVDARAFLAGRALRPGQRFSPDEQL
jgi:methionyl-tRNA formyltransferase